MGFGGDCDSQAHLFRGAFRAVNGLPLGRGVHRVVQFRVAESLDHDGRLAICVERRTGAARGICLAYGKQCQRFCFERLRRNTLDIGDADSGGRGYLSLLANSLAASRVYRGRAGSDGVQKCSAHRDIGTVGGVCRSRFSLRTATQRKRGNFLPPQHGSADSLLVALAQGRSNDDIDEIRT